MLFKYSSRHPVCTDAVKSTRGAIAYVYTVHVSDVVYKPALQFRKETALPLAV